MKLYVFTMNKTEAIQYFGNASRLASALDITRQAVSNWPEEIPRGRQYELQALTGGVLKVTPKKAQTKDDVQRPKAS
ncbi:Cro/CI family transcriptional regulator [Thalassolituus sp. UBA3500]|uniref:Cro/CI family transcriptional regulator n=1 Tax=Thalassolituus sp. UBA3500 TaxID=1947664 RepID=UPI0026C96420